MSTEKTDSPGPIPSDSVDWVEWSAGPRFGERYRHLSLAAMGGDYHVGVAIEELGPGRQSSPAHYHIFEEEHVYVLDGAMTVRIGTETFEMHAGDYVCFPAGRKLGHCLINRGDAPCRYVIVGENNPNEVAVYTDGNKVLVRALGRRALFDLSARRDYWDGEDIGAPREEIDSFDLGEDIAEAPAVAAPPISSHDLAWEAEEVGSRFGGRSKRLTFAAVGGDYHVGMRIESPAPGMRLAPSHYHMLEEEHALILEGEVTLILGEERHAMKPGDYVCFPAGQRIGHSFLNDGAGPCSYLMIGESNPNDVCIYPDSNKVSVKALGDVDRIFDRSAVRGYWDGEETG